MPSIRRSARLGAVVSAVGALGAFGLWGSAGASDNEVKFRLDPSSDPLAACMPKARLEAEVEFTTDRVGFDTFEIKARRLPPNRSFTVFLSGRPPPRRSAPPSTSATSRPTEGQREERVPPDRRRAFSSQIVNGARHRVDLNRIGVWFADPKDDEFCLGPGGGAVTPFDGDNEAGVQAFNSRNADPLPAP